MLLLSGRMPDNRLPGIMKNYRPKGRRNQGRPDFWICEIRTGEQVAELHDSLMMMMMMTMTIR